MRQNEAADPLVDFEMAGSSASSRFETQPANDNVAGTITSDDRPFFLALALACALVLALAVYAALNAPADDVMAVLRR